MRSYPIYTWQQAPFLRLIIPFIAGIVLQWYVQPTPAIWWALLPAGMAGIIVFNGRFTFFQFRYKWVNGVFVHALFFALGALLCWYRNPENGIHHLSKYYRANDFVIVTIEEPLSEKEKSFKAIASVEQVVDTGRAYTVTGTVVLYFKKDTAVAGLEYGHRLLFSRPLQPIQNRGGPEAFDYRRYMAMQGIYQQVYLRADEFIVLPGKKQQPFKQWLLATREKITGILSRYIPGRPEAGLAEALLIGYKDDLDKTLLQSYTNTGVVHIIAISGLHVGLIYWLLGLLTAPLQVKRWRWMQPVVIITGLWLFALLAGGGPSVLRSALMFSCMVIGQKFFSGTSIYNTLAVSAFILLCIDPYWCWDVGFQLSYAAVLSIVIFMKPVYHCLHVSNKGLDFIWKLNAVTLAAQVLTVPVSIYHFHQFPVYFLITNVVAVPLSTLVVLGEIILCALAVVPVLAAPAGIALQACIRLMNRFIGHMESMPLALLGGLQINGLQLVLLYVVIAGIACWLMFKSRQGLLAALLGLLGMVVVRSWGLL